MSALARRSALVLALLFGLLFAIGTGLLWYWNEPVWYALVFAFVVLGFQYLIGPIIIDNIFSIRWADPDEVSPEFGQWFLKTCETSRIGLPRFGIISDGNPNAFAYGRTRSDSRIVVTSGLVSLLSPEELRAVVAHEIGHVAHRDFIVMTAAQAVPLALYILYVWTRRRSGSYAWLISIGAYLVYIFSQYVVLVLSRVRESFADQSSAVTTRDPNALAAALVKIAYGLAREREKIAAKEKLTGGARTKKNRPKKPWRAELSNSLAAMGIANLKAASGFAFTTADASGAFSPAALANALEWELKNPWARWFELQSTHPLTGRRVRAMSETAKRMGLPPLYDASRALATRCYTGSFATEFLIYALPLLGALTSLAFAFARSDLDMSWRTVWYAMIGYGIGRFIKTVFIYPRLDGQSISPSSLSQSGLTGSPVDSGSRTIESLVTEEINASHINGVPCVLEGKIIGRGVPGLFWSKDLVLRDATGLIQLIYRQPLRMMELWFGLSKAEYVIGHSARVYGWYRRAPVPYVEVSRVDLKDSRERLRCYYKWGSYATGVLCVVVGLMLLAMI